MLKSILLLMLILPSFVRAQNKWKIGVEISPDVCYRTINYQDNDSKSYYNAVNSDQARFGFTAGISTIYRFTEKFELQFGFSYSHQSLLFKMI